jgi:hypothetical protein
MGAPPSQVSQELVGIKIILDFLLLIKQLLFSGKTCMLYYILILCLIRAKPFLFQNPSGRVRYINNEVLEEFTIAEIPGQDVLALVDADGLICVPRQRLFETKLRVLLVSSPRTKQDRKWLVWDVDDEDAVFIVKPWSREDFLVMMFVYIPPQLIYSLIYFIGYFYRLLISLSRDSRMLRIFVGTTLGSVVGHQHRLMPYSMPLGRLSMPSRRPDTYPKP